MNDSDFIKDGREEFGILYYKVPAVPVKQYSVIWKWICCCWVSSAVSDPVWPHRQKPIRLLCPWDSPGKNTGVGCHFLLLCMKVKSEREVAQSCPTLSDPMDCSLPRSSIHGIFQLRVLEWGAIQICVNVYCKLYDYY